MAFSVRRFPRKVPENVREWTRFWEGAIDFDLQREELGRILYPQSEQERTNNVEPVLSVYEHGNVLRYDADPTGINDSTAAFQAATNSGHNVIIPHGNYRVNEVTYSGRVVWLGQGQKSVIFSDSRVLTVTAGSGSQIDNLRFENLTAPWVIRRDPSDLSVIETFGQTSSDGYQPTVNDSDIWNTLSQEQKDQDIGPSILFQGKAENIEISRVYGNFVQINIFHASRSIVRDCHIRGGKGGAGSIVFWNVGQDAGVMNRAVNNHVRYASFCGIVFANNFDALVYGNTVELCGESGIKTFQGEGFSCVNMSILANKVNRCFFDGIDSSSRFPLDDSQFTSHLIVGNEIFGNHGTGINADGRSNSYIGNKIWQCHRHGFWGFCSESMVSGNTLITNNIGQSSGIAELQVAGFSNLIIGNRVLANFSGPTLGIHAPQANFVEGNYVQNAPSNFGPGSTVGTNLDSNGSTQTVIRGFGSPEGVVGATVGTMFVNQNGGTNTTLWVKVDGGSTANGWVAK